MHAHSWDLRAELPDPSNPAHEAFLERLRADWRSVELDSAERALCAYAEKLTRAPWTMTEADVVGLRAAGLDDVAIHQAVQVVAYFY